MPLAKLWQAQRQGADSSNNVNLRLSPPQQLHSLLLNVFPPNCCEESTFSSPLFCSLLDVVFAFRRDKMVTCSELSFVRGKTSSLLSFLVRIRIVFVADRDQTRRTGCTSPSHRLYKAFRLNADPFLRRTLRERCVRLERVSRHVCLDM